MSTTRLSATQRIEQWISDRANPLLVRTVRQELRSRTFIGVFVLLLVISTLSAIGFAGTASASAHATAGRGLFSLLASAWSFVVVLQALGTFQAVSRERNEETWDLIDLTGMRPQQVLRGIMTANLVQTQLYAAALAPFLVMAYLLRGIDLYLIGFALVVIPLGGIAACALAVFMAAIGTNKASRSFCLGLLGLGLFMLWSMSLVAWANLREAEWLLNQIFNRMNEGWLLLSIWLNIWLMFVIGMLVLAGALMTHRANDRSTTPRLYWFAAWINTLAWFIAIPLMLNTGTVIHERLAQALAIFSILGVAWAGILGIFSVSEDYDLSPRQARTIINAPRWRRWATLVHGPGAARGRLAYLSLAFLSCGIGGIALLFHDSTEMFTAVFAAWIMTAQISFLFIVSDWLYRGWLRSWFDSPGLRRSAILMFAATWMLIPILLGLALAKNELNDSYVAMLSPIVCIIELSQPNNSDTRIILLGCHIAMAFGALTALIFQSTRLKITTYRVLARTDDINPRGG
jgi:hypothetical protein